MGLYLFSLVGNFGKLVSDTVLSDFEGELLLAVRSSGFLVFFRGLAVRVSDTLGFFTDSSVGVLIELLDTVGLDAVFDVTGELFLISGGFISGQFLHVFSDMSAKKSFSEESGVEGFLFLVVAKEAFIAVRDIETSIDSSFHGSEDSVAGGGSNQANIKVSLEGTRTIFDGLNVEIFTVNLGLANILRGKAKFGEMATSKKKTSGIGSSVVSKTNWDSISRELRRVSRGNDNISSNASKDDLSDDVFVSEADD